ncbi:MAG: flagellar filament capping protein FliD [Gammaproteobacteria bacterium]|nr:flagellar filament capping protein FliD [Gammaproteobacteria bacterium]
MATITSPGIGSGLDVNSIVSGLVQAEQVPFEARVNAQEEETTNKITALGSLVSATAAFESAAEKLTNGSIFEVNKISGSSEYFSSSVDSSAAEGSYSIEVKSLAQGQKLASAAFASDDTLGSGTISIDVNGSTLDLELDGSETLSDLKDLINDADNNPGLFASIITDDDGQHLVLTSKEVGIDNAISISVTDDDGDNTDAAGLSLFAFSPDTIDNSGETAQLGSFAATTDLVGDGTLTIDVGGTSFNTDTTGLTLDELRDQINTDAGTAGASVTASIVIDDEGNQQLYLATGDGSQLTITSGDAALSDFVFDPTTDAETKGGVVTGVGNMNETQAAKDALIVIDGSLTVTQSSNVFDEAIEGVTFIAKKVNDDGETTTVTISQDTSQVGTALADFAAAYNTFLETSISLGRVNSDSGIVGPLVGESILRTMTSQVRNILSDTIDAEGGVNSLASLGLTTNREGLLEVDESLLFSQVTDNFEDVQALFVGEGSVMENLTETLSSYTGGTGVIQSKINGYKTTLTRIDDERAKFAEKMTALESRLFTQFNAMDLLVSQLNSTGDYLTSQLENLPGVVKKD